ncbi:MULTISPECIES: LysR family transcriptional regulator [Desulfitobacterium]|uniref:Transcriptional regulator n=1 Tax=Desulfitobacterium dehalogenans (strain ATCC 51507 / DSM 9161 / JW/IU-DC1) TaxID=756499 RepID=I4AC28_DESDJ|nr:MULTISPECIES: LysR family transcriptional regulator [Desulfitobacterium]AFM01513.1 transcriptional regulator [Desulfitobacterium dehalogenans ATCC 51507]
MRIEQLQHIIEINNKRSISEAAKTFFMGQPQLSHSMKNLEDELGYKIFRRNRAGLIPTCQGKEVVGLAREIINNMEELKSLASGKANLTGNLSLTLAPGVFNSYASCLITGFNGKYPNINLMITEDIDTAIIEKVATGTCLMGVTVWTSNYDETMRRLLDGSDIAYEEIIQDDLSLIVGNQHPLADKEIIRLSDLEGMTFVDYCGRYRNLLRICGINTTKSQFLIVYNREVMKMIIAKNQGIALFPRFFFYNDLFFEQGLLNYRTIEKGKDEIKMKMYLIYSRTKPLSHSARQLKKMLTETIVGNYS